MLSECAGGQRLLAFYWNALYIVGGTGNEEVSESNLC